jgi:hypothetical protein
MARRAFVATRTKVVELFITEVEDICRPETSLTSRQFQIL